MRFEKVTLRTFCEDLKKYGFYMGIVEAYAWYNKIIMPERQTANSAGYDFSTPVTFELLPKQQVTIPSGIKCRFEPDEARRFHLNLYIRSSVGIKKSIIMANGTGIIDADYYGNPDNEGDILIPLINTSGNHYDFRAGDRLIQGIFELHGLVDRDRAEGERKGGVGSTDE